METGSLLPGVFAPARSGRCRTVHKRAAKSQPVGALPRRGIRARGRAVSAGGGSGGGSATRLSGVGGGAVFINASSYITVNGLLDSNASLLSAGSNNGAGSGGSVYLITNQLNGSGIIAAEGGRNGQTVDPSLAGGGGRIAIYYNTNNFIVLINKQLIHYL